MLLLRAMRWIPLVFVVAGCNADVDDIFQSSSGEGGSSSTTGVTSSHATSGQTTASVTTGASAICGNGTKEGGEACDGFDLGGASCKDGGFADAGMVGCDAQCQLDFSTCVATCGNGVAEPGELCDGGDLKGGDCTIGGFVEPSGAACQECSAIDYAGCHATCGNGVVEPTEDCDDSNTVGGDGCSATCHTEGPTCANAMPVTLLPGQLTLMGTTNGAPSAITPTQAQSCVDQSGDGPEKIYAVTASQAGFLTAYLPNSGTDYDSVLYARTSCADAASQFTCADNFGNGGNAGELVSFKVAANQITYIFVDGYAGGAGNYELHLDLSSGDNCGDPVPITVDGVADTYLMGSTSGLFGDATSSNCGGAGLGPDAVYQVAVTGNATYSFNTQSGGYNSVTYARSDCLNPTSEVDCDSPQGSSDSSIQSSMNGGDTRYVFVDGTMGQSGNYTLTIQH